MVKRKNLRKKATKRKPTTMRSSVMLDGAALDHIKLMMDPCLGKMVYPAYSTSSNGSLMRFRNVISVATGATETCGVFHWTPGINAMYANGAATTTTTFTPTLYAPYPFLQTGGGNSTGTSFRCVAACARIIFNGSEMNRGGIVYAGNTTSDSWGANVSANVSQCIGTLPYASRTPSKFLEILWVPNAADTQMFTDSTGAGAAIGEGPAYSSVTAALVGLPATTGVSIETTAVYEVVFASANNLVSSVGPPASSTPFGNVLQGFFNAVKNSTVVLDGISKALDYVGPSGAATIGANIGRLAIGYL